MTVNDLFLFLGITLLASAGIAHYLIHHHFTITWEN